MAVQPVSDIAFHSRRPDAKKRRLALAPDDVDAKEGRAGEEV
jgi:hypothetical protein